ncbi:MAG TPA: pentapeptide repeat-containing protein [Edaphobacter sp.]
MRDSKHRWMVPLIACEWTSQWAAYLLSNWSFLEVLEYLGSFSVLAAVLFYFSESGNRIKQRHYQAWQVINTAQGKGGSGGRIEALQELNADKVPLVGVDVSSAFLQGLKLEHADLLRSDFSAADLRGSDLKNANFTSAILRSANLRGSDLENISFEGANLKDADLSGSNLSNSKFDDANLSGADLSSADLSNIEWKNLRNINDANVYRVKNPPDGFVEWALQHGAIQKAEE